MKKNIIFAGVAALVMFAACQKEPSVQIAAIVLSATTEQQEMPAATKTTMDGAAVKWISGDEIKVFDTAGKGAKFTAQSAGTSTCFSGPADAESGFDESNLACAIYPYSDATCSGTAITFKLPANQTYAGNSFGQGANAAVGVVSGTNIAFKNVCGALKLQVKGTFKVNRIEITGKSGEKLNGEFTVNAAAKPFVGAVKSGEPVESEKKITLDCSHFGETEDGAGDGGVQLDKDNATAFYIVVPVSALSAGFDVTIYDAVGDKFNTSLATSSDNSIARSTVTVMPAKVMTLLPKGYTEVEYLASKDTTWYGDYVKNKNSPYLVTDFYPKSNSGFDVKFLTTADFGTMDKSDSPRGEYGCIFGSRYYSCLSDFQLTTYTSSSLKTNAGTVRCGKTSTKIPDTDAGLSANAVQECSLRNGMYVSPKGEKFSVNNKFTYEVTKPVTIFILNQMYKNKTTTPIDYPVQNSRGAQIYYLRLYQGDDVQFYGIPCKRDSDGVLGMYDIANNKMLTNQNTTGTSDSNKFIAGDEIK